MPLFGNFIILPNFYPSVMIILSIYYLFTYYNKHKWWVPEAIKLVGGKITREPRPVLGIKTNHMCGSSWLEEMIFFVEVLW